MTTMMMMMTVGLERRELTLWGRTWFLLSERTECQVLAFDIYFSLTQIRFRHKCITVKFNYMKHLCAWDEHSTCEDSLLGEGRGGEEGVHLRHVHDDVEDDDDGGGDDDGEDVDEDDFGGGRGTT